MPYYSASLSEVYAELYVDSIAGENNNEFLGGLISFGPGTNIDNSHSRLFIRAVNPRNDSYAQKSPAYYRYTPATIAVFTDHTGRAEPTSPSKTASKSIAIKNSYGIMSWGENNFESLMPVGIIYRNDTNVTVSNVYYDVSAAGTDTIANFRQNYSNSIYNVGGKTTAVMQSKAFVTTLNTNAGLDDDSGIWQYCEGNYPILASEGTCESFYANYGLSSSSSESSSSAAESSSSESSSSAAESSSSESSSSAAESSSSAKSSSSSATTGILNLARPQFDLSVTGKVVTVSNAMRGTMVIFDALGHRIAQKQILGGATSVTLQSPGNYIVNVNGMNKMIRVK